jgi:site-specific recombinase XerD
MTFAHAVTGFFTAYLAAQRGLATNTIASYSDVIRLLIGFACERFATEPEKLQIGQLDRELVLAFLDHLERDRGNGAATRNQRLAAIKTFYRFLARSMPELMQLSVSVQAIVLKSTPCEPPPSLTEDQVEAILAVPDTGRLIGVRDHAMLQLFYNTGARVQEVADLRPEHVNHAAATVSLTGKGGKTRTVPLWPNTCEAIDRYLQQRDGAGITSDHLFVNARGQPLTRFGIGRRVAELAREAAARCPSLRGRTVTPHLWRHTTALHMIESGIDIAVLRDWLGHVDIRTTKAYLHVDLARKRQALEKFPPPAGGGPPQSPRWKQPAIMEFLVRLSHRVMLPENASGNRKPGCRTASRNITVGAT